jgi:hypothetical protein
MPKGVYVRTEEYKNNVTGKNNPNYGHKWTDEMKEKMRHQKVGKWKREKNPKWKGGKRYKRGYILIYSPEHPFKSKENNVMEHRLIAEKCLGRYLTPEETIHHINGIKDDNRPENLYLFPNRGEHMKAETTPPKKLKSNLI